MNYEELIEGVDPVAGWETGTRFTSKNVGYRLYLTQGKNIMKGYSGDETWYYEIDQDEVRRFRKHFELKEEI